MNNPLFMSPRDVNEFRGARQFIHRWDHFKAIEAPAATGAIRVSTQRSPTGNLNLRGSGFSSPSQMYFAAQAGFLAAVEPGIRPLVQWVACEMDLITYTSCEGHYYADQHSPDMRHFGILTRNRQEHQALRALFIKVAECWNATYPDELAWIGLMDHHLMDGDAKLPALDMFIVKKDGSDWARYFDHLDVLSTTLLQHLAEQSRLHYNSSLPPQLAELELVDSAIVAPAKTQTACRYNTIYVVLKVTEVCNLDCSYCFFFNSGDSSYQQDPAYISEQSLTEVAKNLAQGALDLRIGTIEISFHGGEPLMLGVKRFTKMCQILNHYITPIAQLKFSVQTNGLLLNEQWIAVLSSYDVAIGISLDGPEKVNDEFRVKSNGQGSYQQTIKGLNTLKKAQKQGLITGFGVNCVINPNSDAAELYRHFVTDLALGAINFAAPIMDWTDYNLLTEQKITRFYQQLAQVWIEDNNPNVRIELLSRTLGALLADQNAVALGVALANIYPTMTIRSNGDMCPDDALNHKSKQFRHTGFNVAKGTLADFFAAPLWDVVDEKKLADPCKQCKWLGICGGGPMEQRWSDDNGFANKSTYCNTRQAIFEQLYRYVNQYIEQGVLDKRLAIACEYVQ